MTNDSTSPQAMARAQKIIDKWLGKSVAVVELASVVSIAARIEPELLRLARLTVLPEVDSGAEADLWFSEIVLAGSPLAVTFRPEVALLLRERLAGKPAQLESAWSVLQKAHAAAPAAIRLEEHINYLSLIRSEDASMLSKRIGQIEQLLMSAIRTLVEDDHPGLANWAMRVLPRLPALAASTNTAIMLRIAAASRLNWPWQLPDDRPLDPAVGKALSWLLPGNRREISAGVRLVPGGIEFSNPPALGAHPIQVPETDPIPLTCSIDASAYFQREVLLRKGQSILVELGNEFAAGEWLSSAGLNNVQVLTASGRSYHLRPETPQPRGTIRLLHLSDLHLQAPWRQSAMLQSLPEAIQSLVNHFGAPPDAIVITGDITNDGLEAEYEYASRWLDESLGPATSGYRKGDFVAELGSNFKMTVDAERLPIFIVPGNHDVSLRENQRWISQAAEIGLSTPGEGRAWWERNVPDRTTGFVQFTRRNGLFAPLMYPGVFLLSSDNLRVEFQLFDSASLNVPEAENRRRVLLQSEQDTKKTDQGLIRIAVMHHPLSCLSNQAEARNHFNNSKCRLMLHGHTQVRATAAEHINDGPWSMLSLGVGALHSPSPFRDSLQMVELSLPDWNVNVRTRIWRENRWNSPQDHEIWTNSDRQAAWNIDGAMPALQTSAGSDTPRRWALVVGLGQYELPRDILETACDLGSALARAGFGLITGGFQGVDHVAARAFWQALIGSGRSLESSLLQVVYSGNQPNFQGGKTLRVSSDTDSRREAVNRADAIILISGAGATYQIGELGLRLGKMVLPLRSTGNDAARLFARMLEGAFPINGIIRDDFLSLSGPIPVVVDRALDLLVRLDP